MGNARMAGMTLATLKHHTAIQPLFFIMACGITFVAAYCGRLALKGHDVNFSKTKDPLDPMSYYTIKQFKMFNPTNYDYSTANTAHIEANKYKVEQAFVKQFSYYLATNTISIGLK